MKITKINFIFFLFTCFAGTGQSLAHPFYTSVCLINFNERNHSLEISVSIITDDLLTALEERNQRNLYLGEESENPEADTYIFNYLKDNLKIVVDGKMYEYNFVGKELDDNALWCYVEVENINSFSTIEVSNKILLELFESQSNIVQVSKQGFIKSLLLTKRKTNGSLNF